MCVYCLLWTCCKRTQTNEEKKSHMFGIEIVPYHNVHKTAETIEPDVVPGAAAARAAGPWKPSNAGRRVIKYLLSYF